jgi:hypothetical protein
MHVVEFNYVVVITFLKIPTCTPHISKNILNFGLSRALGCVLACGACGHAVFEKSISGPPRSGPAFGHPYIGGRDVYSGYIIFFFFFLNK